MYLSDRKFAPADSSPRSQRLQRLKSGPSTDVHLTRTPPPPVCHSSEPWTKRKDGLSLCFSHMSGAWHGRRIRICWWF